jgi:hypothetical protein
VPAVKVQPGDILQYRDAAFGNGSLVQHHTSVVVAVDSNGAPTEVFEQNIGTTGGPRLVARHTIDLSTLKGGWVRIYRPTPRADQPGQYKFTLVNNTGAPQPVAEKLGGTVVGSLQLTAANTAMSYTVAFMSGPGQPILALGNGASVVVRNGGAYELYQSASGLALRELTP